MAPAVPMPQTEAAPTAAAFATRVAEPPREPVGPDAAPGGVSVAARAVAYPQRGPLGTAVHGVFRSIEILVLAILVPLRTLSVALGRTLVFLLQLPFRIFAVLLAVASYLVVAAVVLMVLAGTFTLVFG